MKIRRAAISESKRVIKLFNFKRYVGYPLNFRVKTERNPFGVSVCGKRRSRAAEFIGYLSDYRKCFLRILFGVCVFLCPKTFVGNSQKEQKMRIAVIGIVIEKDRSSSGAVNEILSEYGDYIVGRMGVPDRANDVYVISVIVKATNEIISAMTGKLGKIENVKVKSAVTTCEIN